MTEKPEMDKAVVNPVQTSDSVSYNTTECMMTDPCEATETVKMNEMKPMDVAITCHPWSRICIHAPRPFLANAIM